jgi:hypothetical protein
MTVWYMELLASVKYAMRLHRTGVKLNVHRILYARSVKLTRMTRRLHLEIETIQFYFLLR